MVVYETIEQIPNPTMHDAVYVFDQMSKNRKNGHEFVACAYFSDSKMPWLVVFHGELSEREVKEFVANTICADIMIDSVEVQYETNNELLEPTTIIYIDREL